MSHIIITASLYSMITKEVPKNEKDETIDINTDYFYDYLVDSMHTKRTCIE